MTKFIWTKWYIVKQERERERERERDRRIPTHTKGESVRRKRNNDKKNTELKKV